MASSAHGLDELARLHSPGAGTDSSFLGSHGPASAGMTCGRAVNAGDGIVRKVHGFPLPMDPDRVRLGIAPRGIRKIGKVAIHSESLKQRRRRVTRDQVQPATDATASAATPRRASARSRRGPRRSYGSGARRNRQLRITDFIPKRLQAVWIVSLALGSAILLLNLLHVYFCPAEAALSNSRDRLFSLEHPQGLARSFGALLLLICSAASAQVYLLRVHRRDDYRGHYRLWLWLAMACLGGAAAISTAAADVILWAVHYDTGSASHWIPWALLIKLAVPALVIGRILTEVRHSRLATGSLLVTGVCWGLALALPHQRPWQEWIAQWIPSPGANLNLAGMAALLFCFASFARFVYLDANGMIRRRRTNSQAASTVEAGEKGAVATSRKTRTEKVVKEASSSGSTAGSANSSTALEKPAQTAAAKTAPQSTAPAVPAKSSPASPEIRRGNGPLSSLLPSRKQEAASTARDSAPGKKAAAPTGATSNPAGDEGNSSSANLSKAERRRLRKQLRRAA